MKRLLTADKFFENVSVNFSIGFNRFIFGYNVNQHQYRAGYDKAKEMANAGKIWFTGNFHCKCGAYPIEYGGTFVCDDCYTKNVSEQWWIIKIKKIDDNFLCYGLNFTNLEESDNYAFGKTIFKAKQNYEQKMRLLNYK